MIRVGFVVLTSNNWTGGVNYYKNLLYAVSKIKDRKIQPVIFLATNEDKKIFNALKSYGEVVRTGVLNPRSLLGKVNATLMRLFNTSFLLTKLFNDNNIQVVSHSRYVTRDKSIKTINWIPDFQHNHLPDMFSLFEKKYREILFLRFAKRSDMVILSSNDALKDYKESYPNYIDKARVVHFVTQPDVEIYKFKNSKDIEKKYNFTGKFFYLPNQLWKHKNHMVVIKAIRLLKKEHKEVLVLCTGYMSDYRNKSYSEEVMRYIRENNLEKDIRFLGLIYYKDVQTMMRYCIAIINPSLFEGWSSTVEEAKSIGKSMILSNLNVHKEQNPPNSIYFDPYDEKKLANLLWKKWQAGQCGPNLLMERVAKGNIEQRTTDFGKSYQEIVLDLFSV